MDPAWIYMDLHALRITWIYMDVVWIRNAPGVDPGDRFNRASRVGGWQPRPSGEGGLRRRCLETSFVRRLALVWESVR